MSWEQSGIWKVVLKENLGLSVAYSDDGKVSYLETSGLTIELSQSENLLVDLTDKVSVGANGKPMHEYNINSALFDFTQDTIDDLNDLASVFGFVAMIYYRNSDTKVIMCPFFLESDIDYNEANTQAFNFTLTNNTLTNEIPIDFYLFEAGTEILAEDGSDILAESGSAILAD